MQWSGVSGISNMVSEQMVCVERTAADLFIFLSVFPMFLYI